MWAGFLRQLSRRPDVGTGHPLLALLAARSLQTSAAASVQFDLYDDVAPFDGGVPEEVISFPALRLETLSSLPPLLQPTRGRLRQSDITKSFFLIDKKPGELVDDIAFSLSRTFSTRRFYIASSGDLDILASGLVLLCCGKSVNFLDDFDSLQRTYRGVLKLGQTSRSYDLKTPVHQRSAWKHVTSGRLVETAKEFVGDILLPPAPITAAKSRTSGGYYILRETEDMSERPVTVQAFDVHPYNAASPEVPFELVCDCVLEPASLIHAFGQRLGCDALLYELQRTAIGEFTEDQAWDYHRLRKAFGKAAHGPVYYPDNPREARLKSDSLRYVERVVGRNWHHEFRPEKKQKLLPYEKRRRKQERLEMEREGLISDEDIMKRKLKKKAVKLVANLNVPAIEEVYVRMLEE